MGHQMLLTEFYLDQPLLPWQQNLRQNGLVQQISPRSLHLTEVRVEGLAVDDVSRSLPQPTLISR